MDTKERDSLTRVRARGEWTLCKRCQGTLCEHCRVKTLPTGRWLAAVAKAGEIRSAKAEQKGRHKGFSSGPWRIV